MWEANAQLRGILGDGPRDEELAGLLKTTRNDVQKAINVFYERLQPPPAPPAASIFAAHKQATLGAFVQPASSRKRAHTDVAPTPPAALASAAATKRPHGEEEPQGKQPASAPLGRRLGMADAQHKPLAERMRPRELGDLVGQEGALNELVLKAIELDKVPSLLLWGPPGCGTPAAPAVFAPLPPSRHPAIPPHTSTSHRARPHACARARQDELCARALAPHQISLPLDLRRQGQRGGGAR